MLSKRISMLLGASTLLFSSTLFGVPLAPGAATTTFTNFGAGSLGTLEASTDPSGVSLNGGAVDGEFRLGVVREAGGTLTFLYQFITNAGSDNITKINGDSYTGFDVLDIGFTTHDYLGFFAPAAVSDPDGGGPKTGGTTLPYAADRSVDGKIVAFYWTVPTVVDNRYFGASDILVVRTNATSFGAGLASAIDGGTLTLPGYAPVPEPGTFGLLSGVVGLGLYLARRRRASQV